MPSKLRMILAPEATDVGAAAEENRPRDVIGDADAGACLLTL